MEMVTEQTGMLSAWLPVDLFRHTNFEIGYQSESSEFSEWNLSVISTRWLEETNLTFLLSLMKSYRAVNCPWDHLKISNFRMTEWFDEYDQYLSGKQMSKRRLLLVNVTMRGR